MKKKKKGKGTTILLVFVFLLGLSLLLYPTVSNYWNSMHQSQAIAGYAHAVEELDETSYEQYLADARAHNEALLHRPNRFNPTEEELAAYEKLLDVAGNGIMGYVEIPSIDVMLPIYHGVSEPVLQVAVGHIEGSPLPVGGPSTHCALSGHRGLPSAKLFTDLDQIQEGDIFLLQTLNEVLTYQVDQINVVEPEDMELLEIEEGEDLCTLVTCTPYGVNSHRLLVRGHRVANQEEAEALRVSADAIQIDPVLVAPVMAAPVLVVLLLWLLFGGKKGGPKDPLNKKLE